MQTSGQSDNVSEKRILMRFSNIQTSTAVDIMYEKIWNKDGAEKVEWVNLRLVSFSKFSLNPANQWHEQGLWRHDSSSQDENDLPRA